MSETRIDYSAKWYAKEDLLDRISELEDQVDDLQDEIDKLRHGNAMGRDDLIAELNTYLDWRATPNKTLHPEVQKSIEATMLSMLRNKLREGPDDE